eukprot:m.80122 g.80122  ORF g.80122 m.80122 type:complete len:160 (-) comp25281_c0_seq2:175-654(-)
MLSTILTVILGAFYTLIGCVKCNAGKVLPDVYAMQLEAVSTRYQPALAAVVPDPLGLWLRQMPTPDVIFYIGLPELVFGVMVLLSLVGVMPASIDRAANKLMILFMAGPLAGHFLGDDFSLPLDSNVGPTGFVPAAVITMLLIVRHSLLTREANKDKKE